MKIGAMNKESNDMSRQPRILVFDNYDSFTYNLVHLVENITGYRTEVHRNDRISLDEVESFDRIILSPGPGIPGEAGLLLPLIRRFAPTKRILGVCLGHQAIGEAFGAELLNLDSVYHGVATPIQCLPGLESRVGKEGLGRDWFAGLPTEMEVGRYHSWVVSDQGFPETLEITSRDRGNFIMSLRHREYDVQGVQFHPESILTPLGEQMMRNWLEY
jgi:anthranilate synthase component 2